MVISEVKSSCLSATFILLSLETRWNNDLSGINIIF